MRVSEIIPVFNLELTLILPLRTDAWLVKLLRLSRLKKKDGTRHIQTVSL